MGCSYLGFRALSKPPAPPWCAAEGRLETRGVCHAAQADERERPGSADFNFFIIKFFKFLIIFVVVVVTAAPPLWDGMLVRFCQAAASVRLGDIVKGQDDSWQAFPAFIILGTTVEQ
jgi:hypothetical protein